MAARASFRLTFLLLSGILLVGCASFTRLSDDPYFAGYHRSDPSRGLTAAITDREALAPTAPIPETQPPPDQPGKIEEPGDVDYTYQDWYRDRYREDDTHISVNLLYHLNGPYYYRDWQTRYWMQYQRRWNRLPMYASPWWFDDLWWDYPYWGTGYPYGDYGYNRYSWWYDPWYDWYYDPWYYDPYWDYGYPYSYYGGYSSYPWYGTPITVSAPTKATQRRPRNRRDLPTGLSPELTPDSELSGDMTKTVASQTGQTQSQSTSTGATEQASQQQPESSRAVSDQTARSSDRQGSYTTGGTTTRSSPGVSRTSQSAPRSSSKASRSTKTSRTRDRQP
ncbi:MAG: hypothetical protein ACETWG_07275 [Candidatus Neomarinimicrobiota bacterium]